MSLLGWIASVLILGPMWVALLYLLIVEPLQLWLRHRHEERIEPSPLIREIDRWREARDRTFQRQAITPLEGHPRLGIDHVRRRT
jgi:hypothetical protein